MRAALASVCKKCRLSPLARRLLVQAFLFSSALAAVITLLDAHRHYRNELDTIALQMSQIEQVHLPSVADNLGANQAARLQQTLRSITQLEDFVYVRLVFAAETTFESGQPLTGPGLKRVFALPANTAEAGLPPGQLEVHASHELAFMRMVKHLGQLASANLLKTVLVALFFAWVFYRLVGRHLRHIAAYAQGPWPVGPAPAALVLPRKEPARPDELTRLAQSVQRMQETLWTLACQERERAHELETELQERSRIEARLHVMATVFESSREAIMISDHANRIVTVNEAFVKLTGYDVGEVLGRNPRMLSAGMTPVEVYKDMWQSLSEQGCWQGEVWDRRKDGRIYPKWLSINAVRGAQEKVTHYVAIFSDISERKEAEEKIYHLAHHDSLTGLANRMSLSLELQSAVRQAAQNRHRLALMFIDLDRFKEINDVHGHDVGDKLLVEVAGRLKQAVRHGDTVARLGGDEFVILLRYVNGREGALQVAEKVRESVAAPYEISGLALRTAASIGLAVYPQDGETVELLMKSADTAMYHAKSTGRDNVQAYSPGMEQALLERIKLVHEMRQALDRHEFQLHYQPQFNARTGQMDGVEALLRWLHPIDGWVSPARFIPVAEQAGLILEIGAWVLGQACHQWRLWYEQTGNPHLRMAVNLSAQQLESDDLIHQVQKLLQRNRMPPECLELEITESMLMEDVDRNVERLGALREMGVKLAIDDFGTGYSSLNYLRMLPIDALKLDRSFVQGVETDSGNAAICLSIIALAHNLGLEVVAEGVETEPQHEFLLQHGCDRLQGFLLGRPVPASEVLELAT